MHVRSLEVEPLALTYVPAAHVDHEVQLSALAVVEYVLLAHAVQVRLVVVVPFETSRSPGWHVDQAMHAVAEFASLSQLPLAHAVLGVVPPGQKVPAGQATQLVSLDAVPAAVCSVPAAQLDQGVQLAAFDVDVKPLVHAEHSRLLVVVPSALT